MSPCVAADCCTCHACHACTMEIMHSKVPIPPLKPEGMAAYIVHVG